MWEGPAAPSVFLSLSLPLPRLALPRVRENREEAEEETRSFRQWWMDACSPGVGSQKLAA